MHGVSDFGARSVTKYLSQCLRAHHQLLNLRLVVVHGSESSGLGALLYDLDAILGLGLAAKNGWKRIRNHPQKPGEAGR